MVESIENSGSQFTESADARPGNIFNLALQPLVVIVGPTAAGKSALGLELARRFDGEIVNYDSVQVYRGFDIGSGKLTLEERRGIPHHLLDVVEFGQVFTAGDFRRAALEALASLKVRRKLPVLVGGTGLYLRALVSGLFEGPTRSEELRKRLREIASRRGGRALHRLLARLDPAAAARIHANDTQKVIRAVEVCLLARQPMSAMLEHGRSRQAQLEGYRVVRIGLNPDRPELYRRINSRVERMFAGGLLEEVKAALKHVALPQPPAPRAEIPKPLEALGYRQAAAALRGEMTPEDAARETQKATRHYAKRQMTWFRRELDVHWFTGFGDDPRIQDEVSAWVVAALDARDRSC